jgi:hypothetical protein
VLDAMTNWAGVGCVGAFHVWTQLTCLHVCCCCCSSPLPGVEPPGDGFNPSTWMLDISAVGSEARLAVDFADVYQDSDLRK